MFKCSLCIQGKGEKISELKEIKGMILANQELIISIERGMKEKINKAIDSKLTEVKAKQNTLEERMIESDKKNEERFANLENEIKNKSAVKDNERNKTDVLKILATTNPELISEFQSSLLEGKKI